MANIELNLYSQVLEMEIPVTVILPEYAPGPFKVLYLYHGSTGDHTLWVRYSNVERYARERALALVIVTGHKSLFTDMEHGQRYGEFLGRELVERIRQIFPCISRKREDTYVGGLSNGSYGALRVGLEYADTFCAIGAFSGGDMAQQTFHEDGTYRSHRHILVLGEGTAAGTPHSVKYQAEKLYERGGTFPRIFQAAGELEPSGQGNGMTDFFNQFPVEYKFRVYPGWGHEWALWDQCVYDYIDEFLGIKRNVGRYYS